MQEAIDIAHDFTELLNKKLFIKLSTQLLRYSID